MTAARELTAARCWPRLRYHAGPCRHGAAQMPAAPEGRREIEQRNRAGACDEWWIFNARLGRMHAPWPAIANGRLPGLVTLVGAAATPMWTPSVRSPRSARRMRRDTRIASVTADRAAAGDAVEDGELRLDDQSAACCRSLRTRGCRTLESPLSDTVPANRAIALRDLPRSPRNRRGDSLPIELSDPGDEREQASRGPELPSIPADELMKRMAVCWSTSRVSAGYNASSDILGVLIARATGRTLRCRPARTYLRTALGMKDTGWRARHSLTAFRSPTGPISQPAIILF